LDRNGVYQGGAISPGPEMRAKALNTFTGKLPLVDVPDKSELAGKSTVEALQFGILNGIRFEIDGYISAYRAEMQDVKILITGGAAGIVCRADAVCEPNLVIIGMNRILEFCTKK